MTHHFGDRPERPGSLFEKPEPVPREPGVDEERRDTPADTAPDAGEAPADETVDAGRTAAPTRDAPPDGEPLAGSASGDGGHDFAGDAPGTGSRGADEVRDVPGTGGRGAEEVRDVPGTGSRGADDVRDAPGPDSRVGGTVRDEPGTGAASPGGEAADPAAPAGNRAAVDPFATAPMPATRPAADRPSARTRAAEEPGVDRFAATQPAATQPAPTQPAAARAGAPVPMDEPRDDDQPTTHFGAAAGHTLVDDAPTEALPVVEPAAGRSPGSHDDAVAEWRPPRQTSRLTTILIIALLVAVGFLAGVFVGRAAAPAPTGGEQPQPAATSSARPGALR